MSPQEALELEMAQASVKVADAIAAAERDAVLHIPATLPGVAAKNGAAASDSRSVPRVFSGTLFRKGTLSLIDQGVVSATNFLTMVLLGRTATQELGEYQLGFSIVLLAMCVQNALISSPYTLFGNRMEGRQRAQYAGSTLLHQWGLSALSTLVMVCVAIGTGMGWGLTDFDYVAWTLAAMLPFILVREFVRRVAFAHLQMVTVLGLDVAASAMQLGGLIALRSLGYLSRGKHLCGDGRGVRLIRRHNVLFDASQVRAQSRQCYGRFAPQLVVWQMGLRIAVGDAGLRLRHALDAGRVHRHDRHGAV